MKLFVVVWYYLSIYRRRIIEKYMKRMQLPFMDHWDTLRCQIPMICGLIDRKQFNLITKAKT